MKKTIFLLLFFVSFLSLSAQEIESYDWNVGGKKNITTTTTTVAKDTIQYETTVSDTLQSDNNWFSKELIILGGAGYSKKTPSAWSDYAFGEMRWMFGRSLRIGPYFSYTAYNGEELFKQPIGQYVGREINYGVSLDSYGELSSNYHYYTWLTGAYRDAKDYYQEDNFTSDTKTKGASFFFGFFLTNKNQNWFGNHKVMIGGFIPTKAEAVGTWKGEEIDNFKPYNKQQLRATYELGVKRFGNKVEFEPLIHTGYGYEWGRNRQFIEVGTGFNFGVFNNWYHDVFKAKVFWRQDLNPSQQSGWQAEIVFNLTQAIQSITKK